MLDIWDIKIPNLTGDELRRAYVYLPDSYQNEPEKRYPVIYMFDGHNLFFDSHATYGKSWGLKEYLDRTHTQVIIASVECNHSPDHGRLREYSPYSFKDPDLGAITGQGDIYMDWLINDFKPYIDTHYRTISDRQHTMLAGSSMGGLMSFYGVIAFNDVFARAACLSPSLWFAPRKLDAIINNSDFKSDTIIYVDYGSRETDFNEKTRGQYARVLSKLLKSGINVDSRIVPGGEHCEASWERQIPFFMNTLLYNLD